MYQFSGPLSATRDLVVAGVQVAKGSQVPGELVARVRTLQSLLAKGWLVPVLDPYGRRTPLGRPTPMYGNPAVVRGLIGGVVSAPVVVAVDPPAVQVAG